MTQNVDLDFGDPAVEAFFDATQEMLSGAAHRLAFRIKAGDPTTVELPAGPGSAQVSASIGGEYRWVSALISRTHPGGAAGTYDLHLTSRSNVAGTGAPVGSDFSFALAITAHDAAPAGVDRSLKVRELQWNGAAITRIDRLDIERPSSHAAEHAAGGADPLTPAQIGAIANAAGVILTALLADGAVTDVKVAAGAAIAESKLSLASDAVAGTASRRTLGTGAQQAAAGNDSRFPAGVDIVNADIAAAAAIAYSKLALALSIVNGDIAAGAAIAESKLSLASDAVAGTASRRTLGTGAQQAMPGNQALAGDVTGGVGATAVSKISAGDTPVGLGGNFRSPASQWFAISGNYSAATDRHIDTTRPAWRLVADGSVGSDSFLVQRSAATAGAPTWVTVFGVGSDGTITQGKPSTSPFYGDGSDGAFTLDGAATPAWATRAGSVYTMQRDAYLTDLTINAGVTLQTNGQVLCGTGTLTTAATAVISQNGSNGGAAGAGAGAAGAGATTAAFLRIGGTGGAGGAGAVGAPATIPGGYSGNQGAAGGNGGAGANAGGAGGVIVSPWGGVLRRPPEMITCAQVGNMLLGGTGGGGGGGTNGGGGGGGGGILVIAFRILAHAGAIQARGGNGGAGATNGGGGGGGGGGAVHLIRGARTGAGTLDANGGAAGAGAGTGAAGVAGTAGRVIEVAA